MIYLCHFAKMPSTAGLGFVITAVSGVLQIVAATDLDQTPLKDTGCCRNLCGLPGRDGRDGRDGIQGPYGPPGLPGEKGLPGQSFLMESNLQNIINILTEKMAVMIAQELKVARSVNHENTAVEGKARSDSSSRENTQQIGIAGAVYTRWGRKTCPSHSTTLYQELLLMSDDQNKASGVNLYGGFVFELCSKKASCDLSLMSGLMAGSHYQHKGSGANHLCLPLNPQWNKTFAGHQSKAYLYGSEFELYSGNPVFRQSNSNGAFFHERDIQCAVCYTPGRPSHVMIPARLECPAGWTVEYLGFLMAAHHGHRKSEYACVDQDPDTHPATAANVNGNLLYVVEVVCGPLPCPDYVDGYEVTCVVCTK